jgi:hypothetical protein
MSLVPVILLVTAPAPAAACLILSNIADVLIQLDALLAPCRLTHGGELSDLVVHLERITAASLLG